MRFGVNSRDRPRAQPPAPGAPSPLGTAGDFTAPPGPRVDPANPSGYYIDLRSKAIASDFPPDWYRRGAPRPHAVLIQWGLGCHERHPAENAFTTSKSSLNVGSTPRNSQVSRNVPSVSALRSSKRMTWTRSSPKVSTYRASCPAYRTADRYELGGNPGGGPCTSPARDQAPGRTGSRSRALVPCRRTPSGASTVCRSGFGASRLSGRPCRTSGCPRSRLRVEVPNRRLTASRNGLNIGEEPHVLGERGRALPALRGQSLSQVVCEVVRLLARALPHRGMAREIGRHRRGPALGGADDEEIGTCQALAVHVPIVAAATQLRLL